MKIFHDRLAYGHPLLNKLIMELKVSILLIAVSVSNLLANPTYSQTKRVSLDMENKRVEQVMDEIERQSEFYFILNQKQIDVDRIVTVQSENKLIAEILPELFKGTNINYAVWGKKILLTTDPVEEGLQLYSSGSDQQQKRITGKVIDTNGLPIPGVNVIVTGTDRGVTTDLNGKYTIEVADDATSLTFSYIGKQPQTLLIGQLTQIDVIMVESDVNLDEVVVIAYGTQKRATIAGSISTVKSTELQKVPTTNLASTLAGKMTGVSVNTRGSAPGTETVQVNIRGKSSWQGGSPLIIIDGIANRTGFEKIDPNDVESISVLKDASAAIYGSRAANGVILVTTKRGKVGKPTVEYSGNFGLTQPTRVPAMTRSWQNATYFTEAQRTSFMWTDEEIAKFKEGSDKNLYPNYELEDYILQKVAPQNTQTLSVRGGTDQIRYYVSGRSLYQDSFFKDGIDDYNSYNIRANIDAKVSDDFSVAVDLLNRRDDIRRAVGSSTIDGIDVGFFELISATDPTKPILYENGLPAPMYENNWVEMIKGKGGERSTRMSNVNSQVTAKWNLPFITEGLYLEGTGAYDFTNTRIKEFSKSFDIYAYDNSTGEYINKNTNPVKNRGLYDSYSNAHRTTLSGRLGYIRSFGQHNINAFLAYEQYSFNSEWIQATRNTFLSAQIPYLFAGDPNTQKNDGSGSEFAYRNLFSRVAYNFKEKYLVDFTLRRDESLKFPKDHRVGYFPGVSLGWKLSEESFLKDKYDFIDYLKIRASYGQMGSDNVGDYQYLATAALYGTFDSYVLGYPPAVTSTLYFVGTPNPFITWEVANSYNLGFDGSLWKGLLGFEVDLFLSQRSNILTARNASVPFYTGMTLPAENIGKAQNKGIELLLTHQNEVGEFSYSVSGNMTFTTNKIIFMDESPFVPDYQRREGHPIDSWLLYQTDGIFNTQEEFDATPVKRAGAQLGDIKYIDVNDDGVIDNLDMVRVYDSPMPKFFYGLNLDLSFRGFQLSMLWQGQAGAKTYINPTTRNGDINIPLWMYDNRWTPENAESATMPRAFYHRSESYNSLASDFWLRDASFLRLKTLELAYSLPASIVSKISCSQIKVYVSGFNLLLFDKVKDYDPEIVNELGIFYPATKVYNMGVRVTF